MGCAEPLPPLIPPGGLVCSTSASQHGPDALFKRLQLYFDHRSNRQRINVAQIVVHENVAKAADFAPGNSGEGGLLVIR